MLVYINVVLRNLHGIIYLLDAELKRNQPVYPLLQRQTLVAFVWLLTMLVRLLVLGMSSWFNFFQSWINQNVVIKVVVELELLTTGLSKYFSLIVKVYIQFRLRAAKVKFWIATKYCWPVDFTRLPETSCIFLAYKWKIPPS